MANCEPHFALEFSCLESWLTQENQISAAAHAQSLQSNEPLTTDSSNLIQQTCHKQCPDVIHIYPTISTTQSPLSRPATLAYERCQVKSWNKHVAPLPRLLVDSCASPCIGGTSPKGIPSLRVIKQETPRPPWAIFLKSLMQRLQKSITAPQHMIRYDQLKYPYDHLISSLFSL